MFKNSSLDSARRNLAENPKALKLAAKVFENSSGTTSRKLLLALDVALEYLKVEVKTINLPDNMQGMTCAELRAFAKDNDISVPSYGLKKDLIHSIRYEAGNRLFFS